ncbi:13316_t:CDS:1, partial [Dentiscutata erythropus]
FVEDISEQSDSGEDSWINDDDNKDSMIPKLKNPKKHHGRGQLLGTKRLKSSHENQEVKIKHQCRCKKCGNTGHYQKNCKVN